ncbi:SDR family oxidoreductase [Cellulomonas humilata]|uniref:NAD(P)-dependent dehydrogenase (Short-subunit alcohol dehydrogenase family) n=1 Tax=Cellulomonas humilata TaxID=144055 RepID=A0ABU0EKC0_9CELL|nr:SDR family oxidoreductase [Cellulomonas humilata]MDQ0375738.1 NAD(P)-dependent dehydrogenase (short-subunit alcohol dehydrogenase family) [Cellulomonas humilata]
MRTVVITGSASGIGLATAEILRDRGDRVIGVDLHDAEVVADLSTVAGRAAMVEDVRALSGGTIDAVVANAGLALSSPATVAVNFYGCVATLDGLRPLLVGSSAPRAALTSSMASLMPHDDLLVELALAGDESKALERAQELVDADLGALIYSSTKVALSRWMRRHAATPEWAGTGIPLNGIGPGIVETPMTADLIASEEQRAAMADVVPMPLNGYMQAEVPARLLAWLVSEENTHVCGQLVFVDGGSDVVIRGDSTW